ncbi:ornithine aminotransferase, mitochondrial isoform X1 [Agrilus planipennis]|uniref:Ornithine aminotransferase n=1 Tax=Agrilus planipennis TaxID=224129 RepID=A0A7F5R8M9_AGRPL|nr:ornithine aminotransferase, mitochondrial isoform X1 [Agrilus planipennis]XP_025832325.1 ornithine aminotransferase, mitochondrial isoform X2 [Agrilus planipennis]XP_025832326.1 ornithine aminotransferase, mitochondrial isoform X1 [Agrilus planipennis]XP_025832327.1 ornithine aminotransferase, mitochondrial isoform X1 [Agrilus planipennis]
MFSKVRPVFQTGKNVRRISSKEVMEKEAKYAAHNYHPLPVVLAKGQGVFVWDVEGKRYYDFLSGYSTNNFGHCHPKLVKALTEQAHQLHHVSRAFYSNVFAEYAEKITKLFGYDRMVPMNTGVEACETSCKISRKWGYKKKKIPKDSAKIIFATDNFWGRSLAAVSASTDPLAFEDYGPFMPGFSCVPYNDLHALEKALIDPLVCAFMVEPIQGEAGIKVPSEGYLKGVRELCTKHNVLWIADEVQTGLGRTGKRLTCDYENVKPDILVLAKALGGGLYPVSAALANDDIMLVLEPGTHGSTFGGNPLASKIAMTALDVLEEENIINNSFNMGQKFRKGLEDLKSNQAVVDVRGKGLLNAIEFNSNILNAWDVLIELKKRGIVAKHTHDDIVRLSPPLIINEEQIEDTVDIIKKTINDMTK